MAPYDSELRKLLLSNFIDSLLEFLRYMRFIIKMDKIKFDIKAPTGQQMRLWQRLAINDREVRGKRSYSKIYLIWHRPKYIEVASSYPDLS